MTTAAVGFFTFGAIPEPLFAGAERPTRGLLTRSHLNVSDRLFLSFGYRAAMKQTAHTDACQPSNPKEVLWAFGGKHIARLSLPCLHLFDCVSSVSSFGQLRGKLFAGEESGQQYPAYPHRSVVEMSSVHAANASETTTPRPREQHSWNHEKRVADVQ